MLINLDAGVNKICFYCWWRFLELILCQAQTRVSPSLSLKTLQFAATAQTRPTFKLLWWKSYLGVALGAADSIHFQQRRPLGKVPNFIPPFLEVLIHTQTDLSFIVPLFVSAACFLCQPEWVCVCSEGCNLYTRVATLKPRESEHQSADVTLWRTKS